MNRLLIIMALAVLINATGLAANLTQRAITAELLASNTVKTVEANSWSQHLEFLDKACLDNLALLPKLATAMRYKALVDDEVVGLALAQATFLRRTSSNLGMSLSQQFLVWLLSDRAKVEEVCETLKPQDDPEKVFNLWFDLWKDDAAKRDKYWRLALACALVFEHPVSYRYDISRVEGTVDAKERYRYYRDASETSQLCAPIAEMAPWELVWVVDAPVPTSELEWARKHGRYSRSEWGQAYFSIRYRMDMAMNHKSIYEKYTLAEIRQKGGICGDQAYFASVTAKANGVPAMIITGWGDRGPHAWFGYEATARDWNLKTGRYQGDKYPAGQTIDPQTRQKIKEPMLELLTDPQRRQAAWKTATRLVWLADILNKHGQSQEAREALETAVAGSSRHLVAWQALCDTLKQADAPPVKMQEQFRIMRTTFARYPDVLATINEWEIGVLKSGTNTTALTETVKRQYRDLQSHGFERTDLQIENIKKQAALLVNGGNIDGADKVYRRGFQDQSRSIGWFRSLFPSYVEFARANQRLKEAAKFLNSELRRLSPKGNDPFAQKNYAQAESDLAVVLEEIGQKSPADSLSKDALQREKRAATHAHP